MALRPVRIVLQAGPSIRNKSRRIGHAAGVRYRNLPLAAWGRHPIWDLSSTMREAAMQRQARLIAEDLRQNK